MSTVIDNLHGIIQALWLYLLLFFIVGHILQAQACKYNLFPLQELKVVIRVDGGRPRIEKNHARLFVQQLITKIYLYFIVKQPLAFI